MAIAIDPQQEYSKKKIEEITGLSHNTVYDTLEISGLPTSRRTYSGSELLERFIPARNMLDAGATRKEVEQAFRLKRATAPSHEEIYQQGERAEGSNFVDAISDEIAESIRAIVVAGVSDLVPHIPQMAALAFEEMARTGAIREAFARYRPAYLSTRSLGRANTPTLFATVDDVSEMAQEPSAHPQNADVQEHPATEETDEFRDEWFSTNQ